MYCSSVSNLRPSILTKIINSYHIIEFKQTRGNKTEFWYKASSFSKMEARLFRVHLILHLKAQLLSASYINILLKRKCTNIISPFNWPEPKSNEEKDMCDISVKLIELNFTHFRNQTDVSHSKLVLVSNIHLLWNT